MIAGNLPVTQPGWHSEAPLVDRASLDHYVPMLYCLGSTTERDAVSYPYEGFEYGSLSMRMVLFGEPGE